MNVIIIEDEEIWRLRLQMLLEKIGYSELFFANSIEEVKGIMKEKTPQLIIADINLNQKKIFPFFLNEKSSLIPTIYISAFATSKDLEKIKKMPNSLLLEKPFSELTLDAAINNLLPKSENYAFINDVNYNAITTKIVFKTIKDTRILDIFNFNEVDKKILSEKWFNLKTFQAIGDELGLSNERVNKKYNAAIRKLKTKIQRAAINLKEYNEFKKTWHKKSNLKNLNDIDKEFVVADKMNLHIDELNEIPTKYRNILKDKGVVCLGNITNFSFKQLELTVHLGAYSAKLIRDTVHKYGFKLRDEA